MAYDGVVVATGYQDALDAASAADWLMIHHELNVPCEDVIDVLTKRAQRYPRE